MQMATTLPRSRDRERERLRAMTTRFAAITSAPLSRIGNGQRGMTEHEHSWSTNETLNGARMEQEWQSWFHYVACGIQKHNHFKAMLQIFSF